MVKSKTFKLVIATVSEQLFQGEAVSITLPGSEGQLTVLAHHQALITLLDSGTIVVTTSNEKKNFTIGKGVLEVSENQVTVLV